MLIIKTWKLWNIHFVHNLIGHMYWNFYEDDVIIMTSRVHLIFCFFHVLKINEIKCYIYFDLFMKQPYTARHNELLMPFSSYFWVIFMFITNTGAVYQVFDVYLTVLKILWKMSLFTIESHGCLVYSVCPRRTVLLYLITLPFLDRFL